MRNPWETGNIYNGIRPAWCDTKSRIDAAKQMNAAKLQECLECPDTQKTVRQFIERRLRKILTV